MTSMSNSEEEDIALSDNDGESSANNLNSTTTSTMDQLPLVPTDFSSVEEALQNFSVVFESRYGGLRPRFQAISLRSALSEAFGTAGSIASMDQRPLAMYLHNDNAVGHNIFAEQVMCSEAISSLLNCQFVLWAWDMTQTDNRAKLVEWLDENNLKELRQIIQHHSKDDYPLLFVVNKDRTHFDIEMPIKGTDTNDKAMEKLLAGLDRFQEIKNRTLVEEQNRAAREQIRQEQVFAYEESLAKDRAKQEEVERQRMQEAAQYEEEQRQLMVKQQRQAELAITLPPEPSASAADTITFRVRLPDGEQKQRRFQKSDTVSTLLQYVGSIGFDIAEHRVWTSDLPRKDVTTLQPTQTFAELGWPRCETLLISPL